MRTHGTVCANPSFNADETAQGIHAAIAGVGTDEDALIRILTSCSNAQRLEAAQSYRKLYSRSLLDDLKSEVSAEFGEVVKALVKTPTEFDAWSLHHAMTGFSSSMHSVLEILCSRSNPEIAAIKDVYFDLYSQHLEDTIISHSSSYFKRLLVSLAQGLRGEEPADPAAAAKTAAFLQSSLPHHSTANETAIENALVRASPAQLLSICDEYQQLTGLPLLFDIENEFSGQIKEGYSALIRCAKSQTEFFADVIYRSMKGLGTSDSTLIRAIVTRCEVDMVEIKALFPQQYKTTLADMIKGDCSGHYKHILLALIGEWHV